MIEDPLNEMLDILELENAKLMNENAALQLKLHMAEDKIAKLEYNIKNLNASKNNLDATYKPMPRYDFTEADRKFKEAIDFVLSEQRRRWDAGELPGSPGFRG